MYLIMLGAQGTGKGTVAGKLSKIQDGHKYQQEIYLEQIYQKKQN